MSIRIEPQELFGWLQAESVAYVVLRDCDLVHPDRLSRLDDVDLLVDDAAIPALMNQFANKIKRVHSYSFCRTPCSHFLPHDK